MRPTLAKFEKLDALLSATQYQGFHDEQNSPIDRTILPTKDSLYKSIQASVAEIDVYLESKDILYYDDKLRLLSKSAVFDAISLLFITIISESWMVDSINEELCISKMPDIDIDVVKHILKLLGRLVDGNWSLDLQKILKASANLLFSRRFCDGSGKSVSWCFNASCETLIGCFICAEINSCERVLSGVVSSDARGDV